MPEARGDGKPTAVMLLGPHKLMTNLSDERASALRADYPTDLLSLREKLADLMRTHPKHGEVVIMECEPARDSDHTHMAKLLRLIREKGVRVFFVLWPCRSQMNGLSFEFGHILGALERGEVAPDHVVLFVEDGVVRMDEDGVILGHAETGNRSWYYEDFLAYGCPYYTWRTARSLFTNVGVAAAELWDDSAEAPTLPLREPPA